MMLNVHLENQINVKVFKYLSDIIHCFRFLLFAALKDDNISLR